MHGSSAVLNQSKPERNLDMKRLKLFGDISPHATFKKASGNNLANYSFQTASRHKTHGAVSGVSGIHGSPAT